MPWSWQSPILSEPLAEANFWKATRPIKYVNVDDSRDGGVSSGSIVSVSVEGAVRIYVVYVL